MEGNALIIVHHCTHMFYDSLRLVTCSKSNCQALQLCALEYLITMEHLLNIHNELLSFIWLAKKGQFDVVELMANK